MSSLELVIKEFNSFVNHLIQTFPYMEFLNNILNESSDEILIRIKRLNDSLNTTTNFNLFLKSKIKIFSHKESDTTKISESLFGKELTLKKIFNNQDDTIKDLFWNNLHNIIKYYNLYLSEIDSNTLANARTERFNNFKQNNFSEINKLLKTDSLNDTTNNMINDIISSFNTGITQGNPFENIMQISQEITSKYKDNIENGDINIQDIYNNMKTLPGMDKFSPIMDNLLNKIDTKNTNDEPVIIDENFSTANVEVKEETSNNSLDIGNLMKTMTELTGDGPDLSQMMNLIGKMGSLSNPAEITDLFQNELGIDMNNITQEMSKMLENNDADHDILNNADDLD
jgi:hypothetical protein